MKISNLLYIFSGISFAITAFLSFLVIWMATQLLGVQLYGLEWLSSNTEVAGWSVLLGSIYLFFFVPLLFVVLGIGIYTLSAANAKNEKKDRLLSIIVGVVVGIMFIVIWNIRS